MTIDSLVVAFRPGAALFAFAVYLRRDGRMG